IAQQVLLGDWSNLLNKSFTICKGETLREPRNDGPHTRQRYRCKATQVPLSYKSFAGRTAIHMQGNIAIGGVVVRQPNESRCSVGIQCFDYTCMCFSDSVTSCELW